MKGAWSSASDSVTPVPEGGSVTNNVFRDPYFGMTYALPKDWIEKYKGPPPSESGRYVLAQISPADTFKGPARGSILITAHDMFFTPLPATNAVELVNYSKDNLQADYKVELPPTPTTIATVRSPSLLIGLRWQSCIGMFWRPKSAATRWQWC